MYRYTKLKPIKFSIKYSLLQSYGSSKLFGDFWGHPVYGRDTHFNGEKVFARRPFNFNEVFIFTSEKNDTRI